MEFKAIKSNMSKVYLVLAIFCLGLLLFALLFATPSKSDNIFMTASVLFVCLLGTASIWQTVQVININKKSITEKHFFISKEIKVSNIKKIFIKSVYTEAKNYPRIIIEDKKGIRIKIDNLFYKKDWTQIQTEIEKVTKTKLKKIRGVLFF
jgi:hypothetical protein